MFIQNAIDKIICCSQLLYACCSSNNDCPTLKNRYIHTFWNDKDLYAFTSEDFLWTLDSKKGIVDNPKLILCDVELRGYMMSEWHYNKFYGICSDYVGEMK